MKIRSLTLLAALGLLWAAADGPVLSAPSSPNLIQVKRDSAPVSLTASDGTGLELTSMKARAVVDGPLALTELHLTFRNPQARVIEGHFQVTLPTGAAVSRLAMKLPQGWQEAEVVELQQARVAYEDFLHRRQDPALLEKQAGNQFQARIFPIPAGGEKEIIVSYSQELTSHEPFVLPLAGLPVVHDLEVSATVIEDPEREGSTFKLERHDQQPEGDFSVERKTPVKGLTHDNMAMVAVTPQLTDSKEAVSNLLVLFDTSASRAAGYSAQVAKLDALLRTLPADTRIDVAAFDQSVEKVFEGRRGDFTPGDLSGRLPLGATNLNRALSWAAGQKGYTRLLVVTDGVETVGPKKVDLPACGIQRLDVLATGGIRDAAAMDELAHAHGGLVLDGDRDADLLGLELSRKSLSGVKVSVPGAAWVWPERLDGLQAGQERLIYARMSHPVDHLDVQLHGAVEQTEKVQLYPVIEPLLERAAARAEIAKMSSQLAALPADQRNKLRQEIVRISTSERVLSDFTGLLVLETEQDYARFHIDRKSMADIVTIGDNGRVALVGRDAPVVAATNSPEAAKTIDRPSSVGGSLANDELSATPPGAVFTEGSAGRSISQSVNSLDRSSGVALSATSPPASAPAPVSRPTSPAPAPLPAKESEAEPYTGEMRTVQQYLAAGKARAALADALAWHAKDPGDVVALVALGESYHADHQDAQAARAYGSIIDLYPSRADLRRYAGSRLEGLGKTGQELAVDSFRQADEQRPDHPSSHRLLGYALLRDGDYAGAFKAIEEGATRDYPEARFRGCKRVLQEDLGLVGAVWIAHDPARKAEVIKRLAAVGSSLPEGPSTRFVLTWETDDNDVDFHIEDGKGGHAYYAQPGLPSGGSLYADVTTGYGPECFTIEGQPTAFPYHLKIHYYSRGPMGYGMGKVETVQYDGKGHLLFDERPYLVMTDHAFVDLGLMKGPLH